MNTFIKGKLLFFIQLPPAPHFALWEKECLIGKRRKKGGWSGSRIWKCSPGPGWSRPFWTWGWRAAGSSAGAQPLSPGLALWIPWAGQGLLCFKRGPSRIHFLWYSRVYHYRKAWEWPGFVDLLSKSYFPPKKIIFEIVLKGNLKSNLRGLLQRKAWEWEEDMKVGMAKPLPRNV